MKKVNNVILGLLIYILLPIAYFVLYFIYKYLIIFHKNILRLHGVDSWVVITGGSSGIGEKLAYEFAIKGFNICIIGSENSKLVLKNCKLLLSKHIIKTYHILKDFNNAHDDMFFYDIEKWIMSHNVSIIVNNIGNRVYNLDYTKMSNTDMKNTIICGTFPQSMITKIALNKFLSRNNKYYSSLINITAQCFTYNTGLGSMWKPTISVPYLSCYEGANAYGYYHSESVFEEVKIKRKIDPRYKKIKILNITPGAVITERTKKSLNWIPMSCTDDIFAKGITRLIGNLEGQQCAFWGHELSNILMTLMPFLKPYILEKVGYNIAVN